MLQIKPCTVLVSSPSREISFKNIHVWFGNNMSPEGIQTVTSLPNTSFGPMPRNDIQLYRSHV